MESKKKNIHKFRPNPSLKLMDQVREVFRLNIRYNHYAYRTVILMAKPIRIFLVPRMSKSFFLIWQLKERCPPLPSGLVGWGRTKGPCLGLVAGQANLLNILTEYSINSCYLRLNCHFDILRLKKGHCKLQIPLSAQIGVYHWDISVQPM
jgi:hypothetical protein